MDNSNGAPVVNGLDAVSCKDDLEAGLSRRQALGAMASAAFAAGMAALPAAAKPKPAGAAAGATKKAFIDKLIARMTVDEKVGQLRLISIGPEMPFAKIVEEIAAGRIAGSFNTVVRRDNRPMQEAAVKRSRLKIPLLFAYDVVHGHRTTFPIPLGLAASFDMAVIERMARVSAVEACNDGVDMTFAPMVDISHDPRWGRTSEGFGEDPFLVSECARASVRGFQGSAPNQPDTIMAAVKHFALYGAVEGGRDYNTVDMSLLRMHQVYLPPYRAAIEAGAGGVMVALNSINGVPATSNVWLLQDLLRKQWGFNGVTVSDHGAITELTRHGVARDNREAAKLAIRAGIDLSMADQVYLAEVPGLIASGEIKMAELDARVREVLGAKYDLGLFADPFLRMGKPEDDPADVRAENRLHREPAREIARETIVLLENRNQTLPLKKSGTIALVGPLADSGLDILGSWSAQGVAEQAVTIKAGIEKAIEGKAKLLTARGANVLDDQKVVDYLNFLNWDKPEVIQDPRPNDVMIEEAVSVANQADVVIAVVGEVRGMSHESSSRVTIEMPGSQRALLKALKATGKPLVVLLMNGRPLAVGWEKDNADALVETWYAGTEGGNAIADVLFGDHNPSAKLPISFPRSAGQIPTYYNALRIGRPFTEGKPGNYTSQYFEEEQGPLYPFGFGLSYSRFTLKGLKLSASRIKRGQRLTAEATLTNEGAYEGANVVQLYIADPYASIARPIKELKGFQKVTLKPGESRVVRFEIGDAQLKFVNADLKEVVEPGRFEVQLGLDSREVLEQSFLLE
ncbi:beta-D-glucoside glucohydrolase, periplasmic [Hyphomicrobiales bacterium]|nr:beta-D-glucoside glucohydrolase, periplasmic [Hyphomicrobiales bacterium]CAH1697829.1 beta-D-glucoside glucohydrolase, periplasmic [Hyphomicrobiales bacterium]CAI0347475.1 beta-D-glucoside glucohydrolase, periplasmic [Hyphomicrobiales bacterium]